jgi:hypothetical protein
MSNLQLGLMKEEDRTPKCAIRIDLVLSHLSRALLGGSDENNAIPTPNARGKKKLADQVFFHPGS